MKLRVKKLKPEAVVPKIANIGDAGADMTAISKFQDELGNMVYGTGIAMEIPRGYVGLLFPRSSVSKKVLSLANSVGVIDSTYRGEIIFKFKPTPHFQVDSNTGFTGQETYEVGERVGQIIILPYPEIEYEETDELSDTDRGTEGWGSTGK
jgi:dUTP pyrophosphatase